MDETRKDGSKAFVAQIVIKKAGAIVHREAETFDRKQAANAWIVKREAELKRPGGLEHKEDPLLSAVIDRYIAESKSPVAGTKAQVLKSIKNSGLGDTKCSDITSQRLVSFARELTKTVEPQTCGNYFSHLSNIFTVARPAWGYPLSRQEFDDSVTVIKKLGLIRKGNERNRRPTLDELDRLMEHFGRIRENRPSSIPMQKIIAFAIFSTRRQEEVTLLRWDDLEEDRILVRDMKHPGDKKGNNAYCELPPEAVAIVKSMPRDEERISLKAISAFASSARVHFPKDEGLPFLNAGREPAGFLTARRWSCRAFLRVRRPAVALYGPTYRATR